MKSKAAVRQRKRKVPAKRKTRKRPRKTKGVRNSVGLNIKVVRISRGITQLALAHLIGYEGDNAGAYICRVENGLENPRLVTLQRIATALGVSVCSLIPAT